LAIASQYKIGQGAPRHIFATLTVAAFRPWRGWACSDCAGLGQCFYIFVDYSNDLQLLKLHNEKEKGKRIFEEKLLLFISLKQVSIFSA